MAIFNSSDPSLIDTVTRSVVMVDHAHKELHDGKHFFVSGFETENSAGKIEFIVTTPDTTVRAHLLFSVQGSEKVTAEVFEGASGITGGASTTPVNSNRNSANTSVFTITKDPTSITGDGNRIDAYSVGTASLTPSAQGNIGEAKREEELILKQNTVYLFRITSGADANTISYKASWYEHQEGE